MSVINILFLSHEGKEIGGSTNSLLNLIHALPGKINPIVIIPEQGQASEVLDELHIEYYIVPFKNTLTFRSGIRKYLTFIPKYILYNLENYLAVNKIVKLVKNRDISIVHTNSVVLDFGTRLSKKLSAKHIWHLRELLSKSLFYNPFNGWNGLISKLNKCDDVVCISKAVKDYYGLENKNISVIYDAVREKKDVLPLVEKANYILFVGAIHKAKGIEDALAAFNQVCKVNDSVIFKIIGPIEPAYKNYLLLIIQGYGLHDRVKIIPFQKNIDEIMSKAKCLIMCSKSEGLGRVTVEAMFNSCLVIGANNTGTKEIIKNNFNGFLYNTIDELSDKILDVCQNQSQYNAIVENAQHYAIENFSEEVYSENIYNEYLKVLKQK